MAGDEVKESDEVHVEKFEGTADEISEPDDAYNRLLALINDDKKTARKKRKANE